MIFDQIIGLSISILLILFICFACRTAVNLLNIFKGLFTFGINLVENPDKQIEIPQYLYDEITHEENQVIYKITFIKSILHTQLEALSAVTFNKNALIKIGGKEYKYDQFHDIKIEDERCVAKLIIKN